MRTNIIFVMVKRKRVYALNFLSRFIFLLITPVYFQYFALGFVWHSIYWGVITLVMIIWLFFIIFSPLIGRIGCGWFCFMGTINDFAGKYSAVKTKWKKPILWVRLLMLASFLISAFVFYFINTKRGITHDFDVQPFFLQAEFNSHYKMFWMIDIFSAMLLALILDKRWFCKNLCVMGVLCSAGARHSRLLPVVDTDKCTRCHKCEQECLLRIPIVEYVKENKGLITNSECVLCGKCTDACKTDAVKIRFVWNRNRLKKEK